MVRCYTYDGEDRGKEMTYYATNSNVGCYLRGDVVVVLNDGTTVFNDCVDNGFFDHCPYRTKQASYMAKVYRDGHFDIDNLANKVVISPGHLFFKLFTKYLYRPLKKRDWSNIKSKHALIVKSIETGTLLHVLSKKTVYFKDTPSAMILVNNVSSGCDTTSSKNGRREAGNEVYVEKNTGCYREVNMQTYPLNPYISHLITRQISSKVKKSNIVAYHPSYVGFLCLIGTFETKHVGRTGTMVRHTVVTTREDVDRIYKSLRLMIADKEKKTESFYVVVNEACVPVRRKAFKNINLEKLKRKFKFVECYRDKNFIFIRNKIGLFFKKLIYRERSQKNRKNKITRTIWVTARDESFWKNFYRDRLQPTDFDRLTGYLADLNPFFNHNVFTKNILAFNTLKNAILSTDPRYSEFFMESLSVYTSISPLHRIVCQPVDSFSARFALWIPMLTVAYASFKGLNQEDCIAIDQRDLNVFDSYRFHTVRFKFDTPSRYVTFHPTVGDPDPECRLLGHLICHDSSLSKFCVSPLTMHAKLEIIGDKKFEVYFNKSNFIIKSYVLSENRLAVCLTRFHASQTGDKLSSFHGQKGVLRAVKDGMPIFANVDAFGNEYRVQPNLLLNPYCNFRQTDGQFREGRYHGGEDFSIVYNSDGLKIHLDEKHKIFVAYTNYFGVIYWADEHVYAPVKVTIDMIMGQALKGRSRGGGMRLGNMELMNGMRGNGLAACYEEKVIEDGDRYHHLEKTSSRKKQEGGRINKSLHNDGLIRENDNGCSVKRRKKKLNGNNKRIKKEVGSVLAVPMPKSAIICKEELKFYKCLMRFSTQSSLQEENALIQK